MGAIISGESAWGGGRKAPTVPRSPNFSKMSWEATAAGTAAADDDGEGSSVGRRGRSKSREPGGQGQEVGPASSSQGVAVASGWRSRKTVFG